MHLKVSLPERSTDCVLYRKFTRYAKKEIGEQIVQSAIFTIREGERTFHFPFRTSEAATSGKLRLIRRGDQIHYWFAAHDSTQFQYLYNETVSKKTTGSAKVRLVVETTKNGHAKAIWKSLTVRADRLSGPAVMPWRKRERWPIRIRKCSNRSKQSAKPHRFKRPRKVCSSPHRDRIRGRAMG